VTETKVTETHPDQDIDLHIGRRLRARRRLLGLTQPQLAEAVGVRFQQIQKYECGEDRISASRLWGLSTALKTQVDYFYDGLAPTRRATPLIGDTLDDPREAMSLASSYEKLSEQPRKILLGLAKALSGEPRSE
jgi:transcriptional regulator with XRE-family HTH domain